MSLNVLRAGAGYQRGGIVQLKSSVDEALELEDENNMLCDTIEKVIVLRRTGTDIHIVEGRDVWWHQELQYVDANCPAESMNSEDGLFILYTCGSTGKPKGIYHTTANCATLNVTEAEGAFDYGNPIEERVSGTDQGAVPACM